MRKLVIQNHHISYNPEVKVRVYKGEHLILTLLNRRVNVSAGFIRAAQFWLDEHKVVAVEL